MNVYDFDKTIYDGDSTIDFYLFNLKNNPIIIKYLPKQVYYFILYLFGIKNKEIFKEKFFIFLKSIKNIDNTVDTFWKKNKKKIKQFYLDNISKDDVIISASPYFLLKPICNELDINLIATNVDKRTGKIIGKNCYGEEKVKRFKEKYGNKTIKQFYTDSFSDLPLLKISKAGYMVNKNEIIPYLKYKKTPIKKIKDMFIKKEFIKFLFVGGINALNGIVFSSIFSIKFNSIISFVMGYLVSLSISYLLNSYIVFSEKKLSLRKFAKFCISYIPNFLIQLFCVAVLIEIFNVYKIITYIISTIIGIPVTYLLLYCFTFKKNKNKEVKL